MSNSVGWFEIATTDIERAKAFYTAVLKASFQRVEVGPSILEMFDRAEGDAGISGALIFDKENNIPGTEGNMIYFNSEDVSIEAARVEAAGGKLFAPKTSIGEFGFIAIFIDTEGNKVGLHSNK